MFAGMDLSVILTYRCQSRCSMCQVWQHPSVPAEEIGPATLAKLPNGFRTITLTGGEPTLREDLPELAAVLRPKTRRLVVMTNGLLAEPLAELVARWPDIAIRVSVDGHGAKNDTIRGEENGYARKMATVRHLLAAGARDVGLAVTIQDDNCDQLLALFKMAQSFGGDISLATLHNGFLFHKIDNEPYNRLRTARAIQPLITELLATRRPRFWRQAYFALGLMKKILGQPRGWRCPAGRDFLYLDPWGRLYACPIRPDLEMGDLNIGTWRSLLKSPGAAEARTRALRCTHNCWLTDHARPALRNHRWPRLPSWRAWRWLVANKVRVTLGHPPPFERDVPFHDMAQGFIAPRRESWLGRPYTPVEQVKTERPYGAFNNVMNK
ncbi:MAG: Cyclic pyranopterin monophosphate synthase 1 [Verrucomicrobia bacterium ADurb.Bin018]|jgi:MoaA/NifB/PqqE/SkfB family radical SAM enzyme|nr:MAG: Cyclic pyranopterin monophosphate synthase 1 [Verrucomicrobia bacterium ADurb.Bin018]